MTEDEFLEKYKPIQNNLVQDAAFGGIMFETYDKELEFVKAHPVEQIWTIIDNNEGDLYYASGFWKINRMGYIITKVPYLGDYEEILLEQLNEENESI